MESAFVSQSRSLLKSVTVEHVGKGRWGTAWAPRSWSPSLAQCAVGPPSYSPVNVLICKLETNTSTAQLQGSCCHNYSSQPGQDSRASWARALETKGQQARDQIRRSVFKGPQNKGGVYHFLCPPVA